MAKKSIEENTHTFTEIINQPELWIKVGDYICSRKESIEKFLLPLLLKESLQILLTGAGSSAFIGKTIRHAFQQNLKHSSSAVSTTSLVTHFENYVNSDKPLLLISFARSGNSPESIAVVDIAEKQCKDVHHVAITCNPTGKLARRIDALENGLTLQLPPQAEDKALAMTGSFTGMLLAAAMTAKNQEIECPVTDIQSVSESAHQLIDTYNNDLKNLASYDFERIVFLGSGPLLGLARESHLKVQELTDGAIIGKHDSFLGFRHGPKAVVNKKTLIVYMFSEDEHVFKYEKDLADEIHKENIHMMTIGLFASEGQNNQVQCDLNINMHLPENCDPDYRLLPYVIPAQLFGFYKSFKIGLNPDNPSENGTISRVVKGVKIYSEN